MKRAVFILLSLWAGLFMGFSQNIQISGVPNAYLRVDQVFSDRVRVTDVSPLVDQLGQFHPENKVLLIQMTGGELDDSPPNFRTLEQRFRKTFNSAGSYEILQVDQVNLISSTEAWVVFTDDIARHYDAGEKIQLVRFVEGETVSTSGPVSAMEWNSTTGGIVAIIGIDSVNLGHSINVSGQGFLGGAIPDEDYTGTCRFGTGTGIGELDTLYFLPTELNRSGNKGEGIITTAWPYTKGTGFALNGGGAGNGLYSGGGGGGNFRSGGDGGKQAPQCTIPPPNDSSALGGWGGYSCIDLYQDSLFIIMGGGGGSGTKRPSSTPSKGGDGGGIIIIITGTLKINTGGTLVANGENATPPAGTNGSGGGGGAGGTILVDAADFTGSLNIAIKGGKGATTTDAAFCTGTGGGGSGGVLWYAGTSISATVDTSRGLQGSATGSCGTVVGITGIPGSYGRKLKKLVLPLTGFLFNSIRGTDTICAAQIPNQLTASQPKGGDGVNYLYFWEQSANQVSWISASGTNTLRTLQPPALTQTTYYRRIVTSNSIFDTSRVIQIYVYPAIGNNSVSGTDTICYNTHAKLIQGTNPSGGNNSSYSYQWQISNDQSSWTNSGVVLSTNTPLDPGVLANTRYFRRMVTSTAYCSHTSNTVKVTVLPSVTGNNFITPDTAICMSQSPGELNALAPGGGDGSYSYSWQYKNLTGNWTNIPSSNVLRYTAGILTEETLYRRIVYSGNDNACIDTGFSKTVQIRPLITQNSILGAPVQYTCYNAPISLSGSLPQDGFGTYAYQWEQSNNNISWETVPGTNMDYESSNLTATKYFRRIVYSSTAYHECSDVSDAIEVRINPLPLGDVINRRDTLCAGETLYVKFNVSGNSPFTVTVSGENAPNQTKAGILASPDSVAFMPASTQQFTMFSVQDDSGCYADINSFSGITHGVVYAVPVANAGPDDNACGNVYTLHAVQSVSGSTGLWTATGVTLSSADDPQGMVTADDYGSDVLTWTETNWHCTDDDQVEITFFELPQTPDAGPDQNLDFSFTTQLQAVPPSVGTGKWTVESGAGEFDNDTLPETVVSELADATTLKWTVTNGACPAVSDNVEILVSPLVIKKGFTPNGDTKNDFFDVGAVNAERIKIKAFNSTGVLVFESDNYQEGDPWDGRNLNGVELPEGTYFYLIDIKVAGKQEEVQFRSFVEILR